MENAECIYHTGPVTALHVEGTYIIAGSGDYLYLYDSKTTQCWQRLSALTCTRIHGIRSDNNGQLCAFGEKRACIVTIDTDTLSHTDRKTLLQDLIWDSQFLKIKGQVVFALAHNTIVRWDSGNDKILDIVQCEENSILYCARFITSSWENLILAAGTVTNQVLLWSPNTTRNSLGLCTIIHRFKGHQGVIFSVRYNTQRQQICSVSDDRSIRIWQMTFPGRITMVTDDLDIEDWTGCQSTPLHVLYGHSARVWDINLLSNVMISIGEDSLCCVWNYNGEVIQKFKGHKGKSIWSLAADKKEQFFVTGGGDTSIRLWKLNVAENQSVNKLHSQSLPFQNENDFVRVVSLWKSDYVIGITDEGSLLIHSLIDNKTSVIFKDPNFKSYTVIAVSHVIALGNIKGTIRLVYSENLTDMKFRWTDYDIYKGKVLSIHWLSEDLLLTTGPDGLIHCYELSSVENGVATMNLIQTFTLPSCKQRWVSAVTLSTDRKSLICGDRAGTIHVYKWGEQVKQYLDPVQSFWKIHGKTGVTDICSADDSIYTAGRDGHYRQFTIDNGQLQLLNSNRVFKGFDWLDKLELRSDGDIYIYGFQSDSFILFSVNNNQKLVKIPCGGGHRTWDCQINQDKISFVYLKVRDVVLCNTDLHTNQFILKESLHGRETTCIKHLYSTEFDCKPCDIIITCSEDTTVLISSLTYNEKGILKLSSLHTLRDHISNVKCMASCVSNIHGGHLVFTGGARAQLVVSRILIQKEADICDIKTSVQTLKSCHLNEEWLTRKQKKAKSFRSNPETRIMDLCVLSLQDIVADAPGHLYVVGAACSDGYVRFFIFSETSKDLIPLYYSSFHDHCVLRITHTFVSSTNGSRQLLFLSAGTDGRIALWDISKLLMSFIISNTIMVEENVENNQFNGTHLSNFKDASTLDSKCTSITNVDKVDTLTNSENKVIFSTSSEGEKCFDKDPISSNRDNSVEDKSCEPVFVIPSHQSGVNGLSSLQLQDGRLMIASGGDDNVLVISVISLQDNNSIKLEGKCQQLSAHAAQITGVEIINETKVLTASVDQRLCLWDVCFQDSEPEMSMVWCRFVNVPDILHMELWQNENRLTIGLSGEGLSIFEVEKNKLS
ncbi:tRNA (34-2'-O)-methyltransferase regulator WDR6-like [Mytilus edulis]|uniref:tRNA (34-2'-O)-methyltransferase regulator WDR6-like n=1 Tax=Mytilus edulis TaxID=6550 RepID=UPI0039F06289